jgi:hypothetical protein
MRYRAHRIAAFTSITAFFVATAVADENPFGTPEQGAACQKELNNHNVWNSTYKLSPECEAELKRRVDVCLKDPEVLKITNDPQYAAHRDPPGYCHEVVWRLMFNQQEKFAEEQKRAKEVAAAKAALEATEVPKAEMHDAKLEKAVAAAYDRDYPGNKVLRVILDGWSDDLEKDAFGRVTGRDLLATVVNKHPDGKCELHSELWLQHGSGRSFSGPLSARGAGSMKTTEILCSKVEGASSAPAGKAAKKKRK